MLVGTRDLGTARYARGDAHPRDWFRRKQMFEDANTLSVACRARNDCWVATGARQARHWTGERLAAGGPDQIVLAVARDPNGVIYALHRAPNEKEIHMSRVEPTGPWTQVAKVALTTAGDVPEVSFTRFASASALWVGLRYRDGNERRAYGVAIVEPATGKVTYHRTEQATAATSKMLPIPVGVVDGDVRGEVAWFATNEGVARLQNGGVKVWTMRGAMWLVMPGVCRRWGSVRVTVASAGRLVLRNGADRLGVRDEAGCRPDDERTRISVRRAGETVSTSRERNGRRWLRAPHVMRGLLPIRRSKIPVEMLAGLTLAALGIPEVLGYAKIAGMPVVTGLYTMLLPIAVFAVLGSSRHLVVAADSATAAILAAALAGLAVAGSERYVGLAGLAALLAGGLLLLARLARLGFLANFLSRTVLVGFLTGVGIQVAVGQLPAMLGVKAAGTDTLTQLANVVRALPHLNRAELAVSAGVIVNVITLRRAARKIPGPLIAVILAIGVSWAADLANHGVAVVGSVPRGLPHLGLPALGWHDATRLFGAALSMFVVILAQSAATSRAYAVKYEEHFSQDTDLVGLGAANVMAAFSGTFVVNGSPTKTQMVDSGGGRSQLAQLITAGVVLLVLLLLTGPLAYLPNAALAAVVFLIAIELIDIAGMRRILACRRHEFAVALLTTAAVIVLGVEEGIALAVVASIIENLRHSYHPLNSVLVKSQAGHWQQNPVMPGARTEVGLVVYRFGTSLYYANASRLIDDVTALSAQGDPIRWMILDGAAIGDVDYTAAAVLARVVTHLRNRDIRFGLSTVIGPVREQLDRYGISATLDPDAYYDTPGEALEAFQTATRG